MHQAEVEIEAVFKGFGLTLTHLRQCGVERYDLDELAKVPGLPA